MGITKSYIHFMNEKKTPFGAALGRCLEDNQVTQTQLARIVNVGQSMISGMKKGDRHGSETSRRAIARYFGFSLDEFLDYGEAIINAQPVAPKGSINVTVPTTTQPDTRPACGRDNVFKLDKITEEHQKLVAGFRSKENAYKINQMLITIDQKDPSRLEKIQAYLEGIIDALPDELPNDKTGTDENQGNL